MSNELTPLTEEDYDAIENAVMETARGRWFLAEHASRNRHAETRVLLDAIDKLETVVRGRASDRLATLEDASAASVVAQIADTLGAVRHDISKNRAAMSEAADPTFRGDAYAGLVAAGEQTNQATLQSAEKIQEIVWTMREACVGEDHCDKLDAIANRIYDACRSHEIGAHYVSRMIDGLRTLERTLKEAEDGAGVPQAASHQDPAPKPAPMPAQAVTLEEAVFYEDDEEDAIEPSSIIVETDDGSARASETAAAETPAEPPTIVLRRPAALAAEKDDDDDKSATGDDGGDVEFFNLSTAEKNALFSSS